MSPQFATTKADLLDVPVPRKSKTYIALPHGKIIDLTLEAFDKAKIKVVEENYTSARDGRQANGKYLLNSLKDPDMGLFFAWQNSYDKSLTLKSAGGANVFICGNGMVRGELGTFVRKHTGDIVEDYQEQLKMFVDKAGDLFEKQIKDKERMKEIEITKKTCAELIGRLYNDDAIITSTQVNIIKREIELPTYNYKADGSVWQFYNHCTVALRDAHPELYVKQHMELHDFFTNQFSL